MAARSKVRAARWLTSSSDHEHVATRAPPLDAGLRVGTVFLDSSRHRVHSLHTSVGTASADCSALTTATDLPADTLPSGS